MMKKVFFGAALLAPCLAYGANPSANLSVTVAPAGAVAAGFTTLALNSDFTQPMPDKWLGGCANPGSGAGVSPQYFDDGGPHSWWMNIWWSPTYQACWTAQKQDPAFGGLVLDMPWTVDGAYEAVGTVIETASWDYNRKTNTGQARTFPRGSYYEVVARITPSDQRGTYMVLHTWGQDGPANGNADVEWDVMETDADQLLYYDSAVHNWGNSGSSWILQPWTNLAPGTNFDATKYNTYALRVTYDGASNAVGCTYVNNIFQRCAALPNGVSAAEQAERNFLVLYTACDYWNLPSGGCKQGMEQHMYVKSVRVWSCADWQTTQCNGTVLTGAP